MRSGAKVLFDAAHQCGIIAGRVWANPLTEGAHLMTMSTYKSLGGPAGGLIVTNDADIAQRLDAIAFPGLTANFDAAKSAALALSCWTGATMAQAYAQAMVDLARAWRQNWSTLGLPVFAADKGGTQSHQFAIEAAGFGGGQAASKTLRKAGFLACGIGLPIAEVAGDMNGLRIGTPELVRRGVTPADAPALAALIAEALRSNAPETIAPRTRALRARFQGLHYRDRMKQRHLGANGPTGLGPWSWLPVLWRHLRPDGPRPKACARWMPPGITGSTSSMWPISTATEFAKPSSASGWPAAAIVR